MVRRRVPPSAPYSDVEVSCKFYHEQIKIERTVVWDKSVLAYSLRSLLKSEYRNFPCDAFRLKTYARSIILKENE